MNRMKNLYDNLQKEIEKETGCTFGKIEKHVFAKLVYFDEETEEPIS